VVKQRARRGDPPLPSAAVVIRACSTPRCWPTRPSGTSTCPASTGSRSSPKLRTRCEPTSPSADWPRLRRWFCSPPYLMAAGLDLWDTGQAPHDVVYAERVALVARTLTQPGGAQPAPPARRMSNGADRSASRPERRGTVVVATTRHPPDPHAIVPGAVVVAGSERFWSVVRIEQIDDDGKSTSSRYPATISPPSRFSPAPPSGSRSRVGRSRGVRPRHRAECVTGMQHTRPAQPACSGVSTRSSRGSW